MLNPLSRKVLRFGLIGAIALPLAACGGEAGYNRSVESVHQPVVSYATYLYDVRAEDGSLSGAERVRLNGWLDSLNVRYGDSIAIANGGAPVARSVHDGIANVLGARGMLVREDSSAIAGTPPYGSVRLILRRSSASVPGCPDWSRKQEGDIVAGTSSNFGCSTNGNLAAMIANPEDLVRGQTGSGELVGDASNKAITSYRNKAPTGDGGLQSLSGGN